MIPPRDDAPCAVLPLDGLRVVDCATLFAGPLIATLMGDFGADVIKVEHPKGDALRSLGWSKDGCSLWWALVARNKRCTAINLSHPEGCDLLKGLVRDADVLIENFRPGTMERWGLGPDTLLALNPGLVLVRTTGFGQTGPYSSRPGFGTLAEALSGFAHLNGWPDKPPVLPPFALADSVAALSGCFATMFALWHREHHPDRRGQVIDLSIYEPLFWTLGPLALVFDQLKISPSRSGNSTPLTAPRNIFRTKDGRWLSLSASTQSIAERVMRVIDRPDLIEESWFSDSAGRVAHAAVLDEAIQTWIGERSTERVLDAFEDHEAAIAPVYSIEDIVVDPHYLHRETIIDVAHPQLGRVRMQNVFPRLVETPGRIAFPGPELGAHTLEIMVDELGISEEIFEGLKSRGVIA